jgi:circadian clock protein KaiC
VAALNPTPAGSARLSTGVASLDELLGGGLPAQSLSVVSGAPGTGKTVLAMQMLFHQARAGKRCIYLTTLSESALMLINHMRAFSFFDSALVDDRVRIVDLGTSLLEEGPEAAFALVRQRLEDEEPDFVVIDSYKVIQDLIGGAPATQRALAYELGVTLAGWGTTTLLVGEYTPDEVTSLPEFSIADGIIHLTNDRVDLARVRSLEVQKMRGTRYVTGVHFFEIGEDGLNFYPRMRGATDGTEPWQPSLLPSGLANLDLLLGGGLLSSTMTLVEGGSGSGKTLLGLRFLLEGARQGEPGVHFGLEETPAQLAGLGERFGWDITALIRSGALTLHHTSPVELNPDQFLGDALAIIKRVQARRVVFDSISTIALGVGSQRRFRELHYALASHLRAANVTTLVTSEYGAEANGPLPKSGLSPISDNVVLLRLQEREDRFERTIAVLKARGMPHETAFRGFSIRAEGPAVA